MPENVFLVIASLATFATVWVWIMILLSQIAFRRRLSPEEESAEVQSAGRRCDHRCRLMFLVFIIGLIGYIRIPASRCTSAGVDRAAAGGLGFKPAASASWRKRSNKHAGSLRDPAGTFAPTPPVLLPQ
jgi:amino acid transporter